MNGRFWGRCSAPYGCWSQESILRDGDPGEPDITLNPRTEFYSYRVEVEAYMPRDPAAAVRRRSIRCSAPSARRSALTRRSAGSPKT